MKGEFPVAKHILVPKHRRLGDRDKKNLLEKLRISENDIPKIKVSDPAIADLKLKPGDIVQVTRKSPTAGESFYYRCVING
jgi:DNA-directed RNA polymerase subunit H